VSQEESNKQRVLIRPPVAGETSLTRKECLNVALKIREEYQSACVLCVCKGRDGGKWNLK